MPKKENNKTEHVRFDYKCTVKHEIDKELKDLPMATKAAERMWKERLDFYISFYEKLVDQLNSSKSILD